ncbi:glucosamine-6-phosphate deaminase [Alteribacter aurantiacus]|uniref:glucosamine-6-phosphate deaminase n=1 Tax=Alteribacter aurantiacus TaxID=254410 RepID=UPI00040B665E|nr:glucosamine-6-phosphate deaminase [Alteribacter aurantiacus]
MKVIRVRDYSELSQRAATYFINKLTQSHFGVWGLATGGTPKGMYKELIIQAEEKGVSFQNLHTVNLDEYVGLQPNDPTSYHSYMQEHLFQAIDIPSENIHIPNGMASDLEKECDRYEEMIKGLEKIDIQLLGVGENGHIGFNEPGTSFDSRTHVIQLESSTREANARYFDRLGDVPTHAITMGIQTIMEASEVVLLASGKNKAKSLHALLCEKEVTEDIPATILKKHPHVTVIADEEALSLVLLTCERENEQVLKF